MRNDQGAARAACATDAAARSQATSQQPHEADIEDHARARELAPVGLVDQLVLLAPHTEALHLDAEPLERGDFAADEGVAHPRVAIDEVGDLHASV